MWRDLSRLSRVVLKHLRKATMKLFASQTLCTLASATSHTVVVPASAVVVGVEHRVSVAGHVIRYTVEAGDGVAEIVAGLVSDGSDLSFVGITVTDTGNVQIDSADPFPCVAEPPLTKPLPVDGPPVVWANQEAPQPDRDFVSVNPGQDVGEGREKREEEAFILRIISKNWFM